MLRFRLAFLVLLSFFLSFAAFADRPSCGVIFPAAEPIHVNGTYDPDSEDYTCYDGSTSPATEIDCEKTGFTPADPVIPEGISCSGTFNSGTLVGGSVQCFNSWNDNNNDITVSGDGTAVVYIKQNGGDITLKKNGNINAGGDPSKLLVVVEMQNGEFKIEKPDGRSEVNGYFYIKTKGGGTTVFEENIDFTGHLSVEEDLQVKKGGTYTYISTENLDPGGFCEEDGASELFLGYDFNEGTGQDVFDSSGNNRHGVLGLNGEEIEAKDPEWQCEAGGAYLAFDASKDDRVSLDEFTPPTEVSLGFWMKVPELPNSDDRIQRIFGMGKGWEARWGKDDDGNVKVYFDINYDDNDPDNDNAIRTSTSFNSSQAGEWIHFAFVGSMTSGDWKVYVNGVEDNAGNLSFVTQPANELFDLWVGGSNANRSNDDDEFFEGSLDDFVIYDGLLSDAEVAALASDPPVDCVVGEELAYYSFEQESFNNDVVLDFSGNNNHAENIDGESTPDGKYCRGFDSDGQSNSKNTSHAFDTNIDLDDDIGILGTINFWFNSSKDWDDKDRILFDASSSDDDKYFYLEMQDNKRLKFKFENDDDDDFTVEESETADSNARAKDTWYYISVTWNLEDDIFQIYVDGELVVQKSESEDGSDYDTDRKLGDLGSLVFGDNADKDYIDGAKRSIDGYIDEVRIYSEVRTQAQIQADMNDDSCDDGVIDHYEIHHNTSGINCSPEIITVKACTSEAGEVCEESTESVNLTLNAINTDTVSQALNFTGTTDTSLAYTVPETATLSISGADPEATEDFICILQGTQTTTTNCEIVFSQSGFRFLANSNTNLPTQLANKPSNIGYNSATWELEAIETNASGACEAALQGEVSINLRAACNNPSVCAGSEVEINDNAIYTQDASDTASYTAVALDFGDENDTTATFTFMYPDAGQMTLHASYEIPDDEGNGSGDFILGDSSAFVVKPFGFHVSSVVETTNNSNENPKAENAADDVFLAAGNSFDVTIQAKGWATGNDSDGDGIHDDGDNISNNITTFNFFNDSELTHSLVAPSVESADDGILDISSAGSFSNGERIYTATYSEVGIIELLINDDGDYLGTSDIQGNEPYVGRFVPAYFGQTVEDEGALQAYHHTTCSSEAWVYAGQEAVRGSHSQGALGYQDNMEPIITITAYNADNEKTTNYTAGESEGFMKLTAANVHAGLIVPTRDAAQLRVGEAVDGARVVITANLVEGSLSIAQNDEENAEHGSMFYTYRSYDNSHDNSLSNFNDHFIFEHNVNSQLAPFPAEIPFDIRTDSNDGDLIEDSDNVTLGYIDDAWLTQNFTTTGVDVYFGRWYLENAFGPETSSLTLPNYLQHWNGSSFVSNQADNCTIPQLGSKVSSGSLYGGGLGAWDYRLIDLDSNDSLQPSHSDASVSANAVILGEYREFEFSAPSNGAQGALQIEYEVPAWFKFNWQGDDDDNGDYVDNPSATVTFGRYRGNDRIISWREISN